MEGIPDARRLRHLVRPDRPRAEPTGTPQCCVLVPVGSTEQHGPHLATGTDSILAAAVCERAARLLTTEGRPAAVTPAIWTGLTGHHTGFGGTFTLSLATFSALIRDICASIRGAGFSDIVLVNGHGGNMAALWAVATDISVRSGQTVWSTTYFVEAATGIAAELESQSSLQHACEAETSMIWALSPDQVRQDRLTDGPGFDMAASMQPRLRAFEPFSNLTASGVSGFARRATPEKGERLLASAARILASSLVRRNTPSPTES
ncbi:creatininase family protein [Frigidibacter sp. ROC022]|uniref:creatininase family protein n=1 Tax=Frigidibacter sp. ROC022 TaxID=2971796 RepID=UPI00215A8DC4|nr:creatininase family protein [Frigidibacter sp. ROC022]MCR8726465.1 creatininase family protein [Frigidibacter sp. ROC022]